MGKKIDANKILYEGIALAKATQEKLNNISFWEELKKKQKSNDFFNPLLFYKKLSDYRNYLINNDAIECCNRIIWKNLPFYLNSQLIEHYLYNNYYICFIEKYAKLIPCRIAKNGDLEFTGDLEKITAIGFDGKTHGEYITAEYADTSTENVAVVVRDYSTYMNLNNISRHTMNETTTIADEISTFLQLAHNVQLSIKKALGFVENAEQKNQMLEQLKEFFDNTNPFAIINANSGIFKEKLELFNFENNFDAKNYCDLIDYYQKIRKKTNGVRTADTFNKKERRIGAEVDAIHEATDYILFDALACRKYSILQMKKFFKNADVQKIEVEANEFVGSEEKNINGSANKTTVKEKKFTNAVDGN